MAGVARFEHMREVSTLLVELWRHHYIEACIEKLGDARLGFKMEEKRDRGHDGSW